MNYHSVFKPPLCKVADAESDVSSYNYYMYIELLLYILHECTYVLMCMYNYCMHTYMVILLIQFTLVDVH